MSSISVFEGDNAVLWTILTLYHHPGLPITQIIKHGKGQKSTYSALKAIDKAECLELKTNTEFPYNMLYYLNERGRKIGALLVQMQEVLES